MPKITLKRPWTYRSNSRTICYPAGEWMVDDDVAREAVSVGVIPPPRKRREAGHGDGIAETGSPGSSDETEG